MATRSSRNTWPESRPGFLFLLTATRRRAGVCGRHRGRHLRSPGRAERALRAGDRHSAQGNVGELRQHGAHLAVHDLGELVD